MTKNGHNTVRRFINQRKIKKTISKQALIDLAHKCIKLSYLLPRNKQTWFGKQVLSIEKWIIINIQRRIRKSKSMIRNHTKVRHPSQQENNSPAYLHLLKEKTNRRIHHIHKLPSSQKLKLRIPTTLHRLFRANKCNNIIPIIIHINEILTQNIPTILVKHNSSKKTTDSPSQSPNLPSKNTDNLNYNLIPSKRRTRLNVLPIPKQSHQSTTPTGEILNTVHSTPKLSSDRMDVDIYPARGGPTQSSPIISHLTPPNYNHTKNKRRTRLIIFLLHTTNNPIPSTPHRTMTHLDEMSTVATIAKYPIRGRLDQDLPDW